MYDEPCRDRTCDHRIKSSVGQYLWSSVTVYLQVFPHFGFQLRLRLPPNIYRLGGQIGGQKHGTLRSLSVTQFRRQWTAPATADRRALGYGKWQPLEVELQWSAEITGWKA